MSSVNLLLHCLLGCHMAHGLRIRHAASQALSAHLLHGHTAWMLSTHSLRTWLHAHHSTRLAHMGCARHARVHLHGLTHVRASILRHAWVAMSEARMHSSRRGLVRGHHLAARSVLHTAAARAEGGIGASVGYTSVAEPSRRPDKGRTAVSRPGKQCIGRERRRDRVQYRRNRHVLWRIAGERRMGGGRRRLYSTNSKLARDVYEGAATACSLVVVMAERVITRMRQRPGVGYIL